MYFPVLLLQCLFISFQSFCLFDFESKRRQKHSSERKENGEEHNWTGPPFSKTRVCVCVRACAIGCPSVNFININVRIFRTNVVFFTYMYLEKSCRNDVSYEKFVRKLLMKLTACVRAFVCGMIVKVLEWKRVGVKVWWCMIRKNERVVVHEREMKTKYKILETDFFFFFLVWKFCLKSKR